MGLCELPRIRLQILPSRIGQDLAGKKALSVELIIVESDDFGTSTSSMTSVISSRGLVAKKKQSSMQDSHNNHPTMVDSGHRAEASNDAS